MPNEGARRETKYAPVQLDTTEWMLRAACRGVPMVKGVSIFFPKIVKSAGRPRNNHEEAPLTEFYQDAIEYCSRCPVIHECEREFTRDPIPRDGMFFGKTPIQRTRLQTRMNKGNEQLQLSED